VAFPFNGLFSSSLQSSGARLPEVLDVQRSNGSHRPAVLHAELPLFPLGRLSRPFAFHRHLGIVKNHADWRFPW